MQPLYLALVLLAGATGWGQELNKESNRETIVLEGHHSLPWESRLQSSIQLVYHRRLSDISNENAAGAVRAVGGGLRALPKPSLVNNEDLIKEEDDIMDNTRLVVPFASSDYATRLDATIRGYGSGASFSRRAPPWAPPEHKMMLRRREARFYILRALGLLSLVALFSLLTVPTLHDLPEIYAYDEIVVNLGLQLARSSPRVLRFTYKGIAFESRIYLYPFPAEQVFLDVSSTILKAKGVAV